MSEEQYQTRLQGMRSEWVRSKGDVSKVTKEQPGTHVCSNVPSFRALICNSSSKTEAGAQAHSLPPSCQDSTGTLEDAYVFCVPLSSPSSPLVQLRGSVAPILAATLCENLMTSCPTWMTVSSLRGLRRQPRKQLLPRLILINSQPSTLEER